MALMRPWLCRCGIRADRRLVVSALAIMVLAAYGGGAAASPGACGLQGGPQHRVQSVIDGQTLGLDDGSTVRLANIAIGQVPGPGARARAQVPSARETLQRLAIGKAAQLWFDVARADRHGMRRAHVTLADGGAEVWLQASLVEAGVGRVDARLGERGCVAPLIALERAARAASRGGWGDGTFVMRAAVPARMFGELDGTAQLVFGEVVSVERARDLVRLVLGPHRRSALTVSFRATDRELLGPLGGDVAALVGRRIEARGYLGKRVGFGPDIDVSLAGDVRLAP